MVQEERPDFTKSSAFSLVSITTAITVNTTTMKMVVENILRNIYLSIILNIEPRKCSESGVDKMLMLPVTGNRQLVTGNLSSKSDVESSIISILSCY
jgi:hypothetical protein